MKDNDILLCKKSLYRKINIFKKVAIFKKDKRYKVFISKTISTPYISTSTTTSSTTTTSSPHNITSTTSSSGTNGSSGAVTSGSTCNSSSSGYGYYNPPIFVDISIESEIGRIEVSENTIKEFFYTKQEERSLKLKKIHENT